MKGFDRVSDTEVKRNQRNRASTSEPRSGSGPGQSRVALKQRFHHKSNPTSSLKRSDNWNGLLVSRALRTFDPVATAARF